MFQFPRCPSCTYGFSTGCHLITDGGFPHSDTPGSQPAYGSPRHFGVRPVLRRHLTPRHPPCALITLSYGCRSTSHLFVTSGHSFGHVPISYAPSVAPLVPRPARVSLPFRLHARRSSLSPSVSPSVTYRFRTLPRSFHRFLESLAPRWLSAADPRRIAARGSLPFRLPIARLAFAFDAW